MRTLSVICPVYDEQHTIPLFYERMAGVMDRLERAERCRAQLFFIENGSTDGSYDAIRAIADRDPRVHAWVLSRNFGYQCAIEAGLRLTPGDLFVVIDVDCEDPPEMIEQFLDHLEKSMLLCLSV